VTGVFAPRAASARGFHHQLEVLGGERLHRFAVKVAAGVDVHLVP